LPDNLRPCFFSSFTQYGAATGPGRIRRWLRIARTLGWEPSDGEPDEALAILTKAVTS